MKPLIEFSKKVTSSRFFNTFIFILILVTVVLIGLETYPQIASAHRRKILKSYICTLFQSSMSFEMKFKT